MEQCRTYGHAWEEFYPDDLGEPTFGWRLSLRCVRCTGQRHDVIDHIGQVGQRRYIYPDGYHIARDETPSREEMRQRMFKRIRTQLTLVHGINDEMAS